ncbi:hypothetical protein [Teredinibacter sp. KSP-S5-2]|uniref:hypothetical protein n=1 Tax=Teredinibacter sp. KSP-S5-2 TaxID=3034506 RepID=UPI0029341028|nr:hypothetical protein [Teredinibacter sp. KSP-S5-2]WNO07925.1 hypothetical protein P5V12_13155 [Teredinibacter sp. KSP-S5-2]
MINNKFSHPYDTVFSSTLRFAVELIAWISGPWTVSYLSHWLIIPTAIMLVILPGIFSTPNDKKVILVPVSGIVRIVIESLLYLIAIIAPWLVWSNISAGIAFTIVILSIYLGTPRFKWLLKGAPYI